MTPRVTLLDRMISVFSPKWAVARIVARSEMSQIEAFSGGQSGYESGRLSRLTRTLCGQPVTENAIPGGQIQQLRWASWNLWRNNTHARKLVRTVTTKTVGRGPHPLSMATNADGTPHTEFRERARHLWQAIEDEIDYRGRPGYGGQTNTDLHKTALQATMLGGEVLCMPRRLTVRQWKSRGLTIPLQIQLINAERLAENLSGPVAHSSENRIFRGIELDSDGIPVAYHLLSADPNDALGLAGASEVTRVPRGDLIHLFVTDDVDQLRGTPWLAAALLQMRDTGDYQYNELKASAIAACVALGIRRPTGSSSAFGLNAPDGWQPTDSDGNSLTVMQPGMVLDLGTDGEMQGFNPGRPSGNAADFIQHMLRGTAAGVPGIKSSTLTGDYRNSSFSSEKSADNDAWPEIEGMQDWFFGNFSQPIYEAVIMAGVESGYFDGIVTPEEFAARKSQYLSANWQGPVALSINPTDDAKAARLRIAGGQSSPQMECAKLGIQWREVVKDLAEFQQYAAEQGVSEKLIDQFMGLEPSVEVAEIAADSAEATAAAQPAGGSDV